ncbi:globin family protein [Roseateles sp. DXS20W]|uniref:Globin family protein n=1 Tax=Pelomonas lactea TaxID=3299030 RepID=A0ABW7GDL8_9BURK
MTPHQIHLIRTSFEPLKPLAATIAEAFYARLFMHDPALRSLFRGRDMAQQGERLMQMLAAAVELLDRPGALTPVLLRLGQRHGDYGVTAAHYDSVGAALLDTLAAGLGEGFTPETREAWTAMYRLVARTMQEGAAAAVLAA